MKKIEYLIIDVDGTMTDAGIYYDNEGNELKKFSTKDAAAFFVAKEIGIKTVILTGRECPATTRRMKELKVDFLFQNVKDKEGFLKEFIKENGIERDKIAYIGDDLNDLAPMKMAGYIGCPADSCDEIKQIADYISPIPGGHGAVRDVVEHMLNKDGSWSDAIKNVYGIGV